MAAALEHGLYGSIDEATNSPEPYALPGTATVLKNDNGGAHCENVSLRVALRDSCDSVFAKLASDLGQETVRSTAEKFGFNAKEQLVPARAGESLYPNGMSKAQAALSGMGQSNVTATPLQMAMVSAALANGGKLVAPHVVSRVTDGDGKVLRDGAKPTTTQVVSADTAGQLRTAMADVVARGAGSAARIDGAELGGKPATARGGAGGAETSWFTSYARRGGGANRWPWRWSWRTRARAARQTAGPGARIAKRIMQAAIG